VIVVAKAVVSTFLFFHDESDIFMLLCMIVDSMLFGCNRQKIWETPCRMERIRR